MNAVDHYCLQKKSRQSLKQAFSGFSLKYGIKDYIESFSAFPALNFTALRALILMASPV